MMVEGPKEARYLNKEKELILILIRILVFGFSSSAEWAFLSGADLRYSF